MNTFASRLLELFENKPDSIAIQLLTNQLPDKTITYSELIHGASGYTTALKNAGIRAGEVVILILQHSEDLVNAFFGSILHGAIPSIMPFLTEKPSPEQYRRSLSSLFEI